MRKIALTLFLSLNLFALDICEQISNFVMLSYKSYNMSSKNQPKLCTLKIDGKYETNRFDFALKNFYKSKGYSEKLLSTADGADGSFYIFEKNNIVCKNSFSWDFYGPDSPPSTKYSAIISCSEQLEGLAN